MKLRHLLLPTLLAILAATPAFSVSTADQAAHDILQAQQKLHGLKSLTADVTVVMAGHGVNQTERGSVKCLKPNYLWLETRGARRVHHIHISDGKGYCTPDEHGRWSSVKAAPDGANFRNDLFLWSDFYVLFAKDNAKRILDGATVKIEQKPVGGATYKVITAKRASPQPSTMRVYIAADGLIHRMTASGGPMSMDITWSNIRPNAPLTAKNFQPRY